MGAVYCGYKAGQKVDGNYTVSSHFGNIVVGGLASATIASIFNLKEIGAK